MVQKIKNTIRPIYWFFRNWRFQLVRADAWLMNRRAHYTEINETTFKNSRKSDTVFIFGSGASLNDITPHEWAKIAEHNTMSFNWFIHQDFVRMDYHIFREIGGDPFQESDWLPEMQRYFEMLESNRHYQNTTLMMQHGWLAIASNRALGLKLIAPDRKVLRFYNRPYTNPDKTPAQNLSEGIVHHLGTLSDAVNLAYVGGWQNIVLVGVDLYDMRYFWLPQDQLRQDDLKRSSERKTITPDSVHVTASHGIVDFLGGWYDWLDKQGVQLACYNPRSLLTQYLPIFPKFE